MATKKQPSSRNQPIQQEAMLSVPLPSKLEEERAILGAMILNPKCVLEVCSAIRGDEFFFAHNRQVFLACVELTANHQPIDLLTLVDFLEKKKELSAVGGADYLAKLVDGRQRVSNVARYIEIVKESAALRKVIHATHAIQQRALAEEDASEVVGEATREFLSMLGGHAQEPMPSTWEAAVYSATNKILEGMYEPQNVMRLQTGISDVDGVTSGFRREDVVLIVGITGHGKTTLAEQITEKADTDGYIGTFFSGEMSKEQLLTKALARASGMPLYWFRRPELVADKADFKRRLMEAAGSERMRKIEVLDAGVRPERIWALTELAKRSKGLDFTVSDFLQLIVRRGMGSDDDKYDMQAEFAQTAVEEGKRLQIAQILLCQPRKVDRDVASGKRPPTIEDISGSSEIANAAHHILWIVREFQTHGMDPKYERLARLYVLKSRNDKTAMVKIGFDPDAVKFVNRDPSEEDSTEDRPQRARKHRGQGRMYE